MSSLAAIVELVRDFQTTRLVSAVGLVILIYDHLLSLPDEVRFIWSAKFTSSKVLFLGMRYIVPVVMIVHTVQLSGLSHIQLSDMLQGLVYHWGLVLLRLWILWDRNRIFIICTFLMFLASIIAVFVLTILDFIEMIPNMSFAVVCTSDTSFHKLRFLWLPGIIFQSVMVLGMVSRVITRPHIIKTLLRDGYLYFLLLFGINLINATLVLAARPSLMLVTVFLTWCCTTTVTCRMILRLRRSSYLDSNKDSADDDIYEDIPRPVELAWLRQQSRDPTPTPTLTRSTFL
ncbi:hypothetical protein B0H14DRAFT_3443171 [Mycena olivaceomarginata]|nr:hypothetical protein B0H14DRAFT_3443171 [Mycena olivaceomarginata]